MPYLTTYMANRLAQFMLGGNVATWRFFRDPRRFVCLSFCRVVMLLLACGRFGLLRLLAQLRADLPAELVLQLLGHFFLLLVAHGSTLISTWRTWPGS